MPLPSICPSTTSPEPNRSIAQNLFRPTFIAVWPQEPSERHPLSPAFRSWIARRSHLVDTVLMPRYRYQYTVHRDRARNLLAHPTLDMYLPLSKFESIPRVYIALRCNHNMLSLYAVMIKHSVVSRLAQPRHNWCLPINAFARLHHDGHPS